MDGLNVGTTPAISMVPLSKNRVRMSLAFEPTISFSMGRPSLPAAKAA